MQPHQAISGSDRSRAAGELAGWLLLAMLVFATLRTIIGDAAIWLGGATAWLAAVLLWPRISRNQRIQVVVIIMLGLVFGLWGVMRGAALSLEQALGQNQMILGMLAAVSFLKLVNRPVVAGERIPAGRGAFIRTLLGLHVFGAAINITAMTIVSDRLAAQSRFGALQAAMVSRAFCLSVMYSPFIGGMALALALTPGSRLEVLAAVGIPFAGLGLLVTWILLDRSFPDEVGKFKGYPIHLGSLWIPLLLAVCVALLHRAWPGFSVLTLISVSAPMLVALIVFARGGIGAGSGRLVRHVRHTLPEMSGELLLFLGAGVLAAGLSALFTSFGDWTPFAIFDGVAASATLTGIVALSIVGVHPIVCVSFLAPLLAPISPEPNLLALVFISGWAIGCTLSPFSGTNLTMQGRYGVRNWSTTLGNLGYGALMLGAACGLLIWFDAAR